MEKRQYIKVFRHFNTLHNIFRDQFGNKHYEKFTEFDCELFIESSKETKFTSLIDGRYLSRIPCSGFAEFKDAKERNSGVYTLYGDHKPEDQFRRANYYEKEVFMTPKICYFDIETAFNGSFLDDDFNIVKGVGGFAKPDKVNAPITSFACYFDGKMVALGMKALTKDIPNVKYYQCSSEVDMIETFFKLMKHWDPDILTGWNAEGFDFPFIVNRMKKLEMDIKMIDPQGYVEEDRVLKIEMPKSYYWLDMMLLYKNFVYEPRESYSLQFISEHELGDGKVEYHDTGSLEDLYNQDFDKFIEYNCKDVQLLFDLDMKINLMPLVCELSYLYNINFNIVTGTTGPWAQLMYCESRKNNQIIPEKQHSSEDMDFEGGFVHCNPGHYQWAVSFDFASLYPSIIRAFNLCPSTYVNESDIPTELKHIRAKYIKSDTYQGILDQINLTRDEKSEIGAALKKYNMTLTPSGHFFRLDKEGISPYMMGKIYNDRKVAKKKMLEAQKKLYESTGLSDTEKEKLKGDVTRYNNQQMALKIGINSFFGALGNAYFLLTKKAVAESITSAGRLYDRSVKVLLDAELSKRYEYDREPCFQSDTDSCYFYLLPIVNKYNGDDILEYIDSKVVPVFDKMIKTLVLDDIAEYRNLMNPSVMDMEREVIADSAFAIGKKNYTMNVLDSEGTRFEHGKKKIVGLNLKKTNLPLFVRKKMLEFLDLLYKGNEKAFQDDLSKFKIEFASLPVADISFPKGVNLFTDKTPKGVKIGKSGRNEYTLETSGCPINVRASLLYNKYLEEHDLLSKYDKIEDGSKMKYIYLKTPNSVWNQNVIGFPNDHKHRNFIEDVGLSEYVDHKMLFEGLVHKPLEPLVELLEWNFTKTIKLTSFF